MLSSADQSFLIVAKLKGLLDAGQAAQLEAELRASLERGEDTDLAALAVYSGTLDETQIDRILRTRMRHGRVCSDCYELTFLLPNQRSRTTPCEHCGGALSPGAAPEAMRPRFSPGIFAGCTSVTPS